MTHCFFSLTNTRTKCYAHVFSSSGLRPTIMDLRDGTVMHCWVPKSPTESKPNLLLIHGFGANALWQWGDYIRSLTRFFNVYLPDLVFFGGSYSTRPERSDVFQAECMMRVMEGNSVGKVTVVGLSYGGFVAYSLTARYGEMVERLVVCGSGVAMEEKDIKEELFPARDLDEAVSILVPQTPEKLKELVKYSFYKPPPVDWIPTCFLLDFIDAMCRDHVQEKREIIEDVAKDRKLSELPKIPQPTLIIWGEYDQIFPIELGYRLKRHLGDNAQLAVIKDAGHAVSVEKPKEFFGILKSFLIDSQTDKGCSSPKLQSNKPA